MLMVVLCSRIVCMLMAVLCSHVVCMLMAVVQSHRLHADGCVVQAAFAAMVPMFRDVGVLPSGHDQLPYAEAIADSTGLSVAPAGVVCDYLHSHWLVDCRRQVY